MTEMEAGHFAGTRKVLAADRQVASEKVLAAQFRSYVDLAGRYAPTGRWLDIGCGGGLLTTLARDAGYTSEGIELTADRREAARSTGITIHDRPVEDIHFSDEEFDVISLINVFSHLTSPAATLAELQRILRPGGVMILVTGEVGADVQKSHVANWNLGDHLYFLGDRTMSAYTERVGLQITGRDRVWLPEATYTREWLQTKGRSTLHNAVKTALANTPGAWPVFRSLALRRQVGNPIYTTTFAISKVPYCQ